MLGEEYKIKNTSEPKSEQHQNASEQNRKSNVINASEPPRLEDVLGSGGIARHY
jgi:hypothetical protein